MIAAAAEFVKLPTPVVRYKQPRPRYFFDEGSAAGRSMAASNLNRVLRSEPIMVGDL